jgi:Spy/CpxP family protein refolding chaperone
MLQVPPWRKINKEWRLFKMSRRVLLLVLLVVPVLTVGFVTGEEYVETISGEDGKEVVVIMKGGEAHEMMMENLGGWRGMIEGMDGPRMMGHGSLLSLRDELGLTDDQVKRLRELRMDREKQAINDRATVEILELELRELLFEEDVDIKAVDTKIDRIASLNAKMHKDRIHGMLDSRKVLTAEQQKKMKDLSGPGMGMMKKRIEYKKMIKE